MTEKGATSARATNRPRSPLPGLLVVVGVCAAVALCVQAGSPGEGQRQALAAKKAADAARQAAGRAVDVLPPGTEGAWNAWIDEQVSKSIIPQGNAVEVKTFLGLGPVYYSRNTPYKVDCSFGIIVKFGAAVQSADSVDGDEVWIEGPGSTKDSPPLNVPVGSIAALRLREALCARVAASVGQLMR
jgi:hypothetical protein